MIVFPPALVNNTDFTSIGVVQSVYFMQDEKTYTTIRYNQSVEEEIAKKIHQL